MSERIEQGERTRLSLLAVLVIASGGIGWGQDNDPAWRLQSDGTWLAETVSIGQQGSQVFAEYGAYQNSVVLLSSFDVSPPTPAWADERQAYNFVRRVESSADAGVHVSLHQEFLPGSYAVRQPVLRCYSSDSAGPDWTCVMPVDIPGHAFADVRVSASGDRILGVVYDSYQGKTYLSAFDSSSENPISEHWIQTLGPFRALDMSADGTTAVVASDLAVMIIDVATTTIVHTKYLMGAANFGAVSLSEDASTLVFGTIGKVLIFERGASGTYTESANFVLPAETYCGELDLSRDGSTLVMGLNSFQDPLTARVLAIDFDTRETVTEYATTGTGEFQNAVSGVGVAVDGSRFVVGLWGDEGETVPELLVFERGQNAPVNSIDLPGSVNAIDLSPDGDHVAVASKIGHANEAGAGGAFWLFETRERDLNLCGVPSVGDTVQLEHQTTPGTLTRTLVSSGLASEPRDFGHVGSLVLNMDSMNFLPGSAVADGEGVARKSFTIPNDGTLIGTTLYFQGFGLRPRKLTNDWVAMSILP